MYFRVRTSSLGQDEPAIVVHANAACHQDQHVPTSIIDSCGVLSGLLETSGCTSLPYSTAQVQLWLRFREKQLSGQHHNLNLAELFIATQVRSQNHRTNACTASLKDYVACCPVHLP